jgi:hypothetical protein
VNGARRLFSGLLLAGLGSLMVVLPFTTAYWYFLNPRFQHITATAGVVLMLAGILVPTDRVRRPSFMAMAVFAIFLPLAMEAVNQADRPSFAAGALGGLSSVDRGPPRLEIDGREYIRLNPAELLLQGEKTPPDPRPFVTEGMIMRTAEMDADGHVALVRLIINCCFADALAAGVRIAVDDPDAFEKGQWLRVAGHLRPAEKPRGRAPAIPGVIATILGETTAFEPEAFEPMADHPEPYIFDIRSEEPFNY